MLGGYVLGSGGIGGLRLCIARRISKVKVNRSSVGGFGHIVRKRKVSPSAASDKRKDWGQEEARWEENILAQELGAGMMLVWYPFSTQRRPNYATLCWWSIPDGELAFEEEDGFVRRCDFFKRKKKFLRAGFEPATYGLLIIYKPTTVHRSTNWAIEGSYHKK